MTKDGTMEHVDKVKRYPYEEITPSLNLYKKALRRILRDRPTLMALGVISALVLIAIMAPILSERVFQVDQVTQQVRNKYRPLFTEGHCWEQMSSGAII